MATVPPEEQIKNISSKEQASFVRSQLILFQSRKKFGLLYALATVAGLFCIPGTLGIIAAEIDALTLILRIVPLPFITLLVSIGMYILNDLIDVDLDRANGKKRPIPSGQVSEQQAWSFIFLTNGAAVALAAITANTASMILTVPMLAIGIMYSAPRISLMNRFVIKNAAISAFYMLCALLGMTSGYGLDFTTSSIIAAIHAMAVFGIMIFVGSIVNDLGDVRGDKAEGRRTIPVVIGGVKTIQILMILLVAIPILSWTTLIIGVGVGIFTAVATSIVSALALYRMKKMREGLVTMDMDFMRKQHKKWFPLHMVLQSSLVLGAILI
ncbi:MAG: UbiA family prenyltransferase [Nitrososphaera sp.]